MWRADSENQEIVYRIVKREIIHTEDGSTTIRIADWDECYHSKHGAIQEAYHVFIKNGLSLFIGKPICVLEIGFGTGLNAFITFVESKKYGPIKYTGVEAYPISAKEVTQMNYVSELNANEFQSVFDLMHESDWEKEILLSENFSLTKRKLFFDQIDDKDKFDLIYFDAFGFRVQPELWRLDIFKRMHAALKNSGILVTYAARGVVKRNLQEAGFRVEKLAGPPGKREMMRAFKE
jgi:tRNA U34 5-methylaminomethyl-2-thiouridine-forming methyltransferase MnmC